MKEYTIWTHVILPATVNSSPSPALFAACMDGNFHGSETVFWPLRVYEHDIPLIYHIWKKMDIRKVKVDHLTLLVSLPGTLNLVSKLEVEASGFCVEFYGNIYFIYLIPN